MMSEHLINRPDPENLTSYVRGYVNEAQGDDLLTALESSLDATMNLFLSVEKNMENHTYEAGKWTIKEVLSHVIDTERIFSYRALTIARNDTTPIPGFDENAYVPFSNASGRSIVQLIHEYELVRRSSMILFESFTEEMLDRTGTANNMPLTPRIIGWMLAGHDAHHADVIRKRYLPGTSASPTYKLGYL